MASQYVIVGYKLCKISRDGRDLWMIVFSKTIKGLVEEIYRDK